MKTDLYTKVILTIIALALSANVIKGLITPAMADDRKFATVPVNTDGSINVKLVKGSGTIDVNIESVDATAFSLAEPIEVKVKD